MAAKRPDIAIYSVHDWDGGQLRGISDEAILRAASAAGLTLVTCDVNTILLLLVRLANDRFVHGGIVFVHNATIPSNASGALVRALIRLYDLEHETSWRDRVWFLTSER